MKKYALALTLFLFVVLSLKAQYDFEEWKSPEYAIADAAAEVTYLSDKEKDVIKIMNYARLNGKLFAETYLKKYAALKGKQQLKQVKSLSTDLLNTPILEVYSPNEQLSKAAKAHAEYMGKKGDIGHIGKGGKDPAQRVEDYIGWDVWISENIQYGVEHPAEIVLALLIDEKVPNLGHRKNILEKRGRYVGIAIAPHKSYKTNCVMDYTGGLK